MLESLFPMSTHKPAPGHSGKLGKDHPVQNNCFACGKGNADGMQLDFYFDEAARTAFCNFNLAARYQGPPGHAHGGIIATILDEAMGKVNKLRHVIALTSRIQIEYLKPVPLAKPLVIESWEKSVRGRRHVNVGEIRNEKGEVLARGRAVFIAIDPHRMFAKHLPKSYRLGGFISQSADKNRRKATPRS
jgi:acyl-coenzyme A thioesterase PaaI-like protein